MGERPYENMQALSKKHTECHLKPSCKLQEASAPHPLAHPHTNPARDLA